MKATIMKLYNSGFFFVLVFLICSTCLISSSNALSCDSCGHECSTACGTKHFRTCCFNYLRKRSVPSPSDTMNFPNTNSNPSLTKNHLSSGKLSPLNVDEFLQSLLRNTKDIETIVLRAIQMEKINIALGNKKRHLNDNFEVDYA